MLDQQIFEIDSAEAFNKTALAVFAHQFKHNKVYRSFCDLLHRHPNDVTTINEIPFLPISFFKSRTVVSSTDPVKAVFTSSGTTGSLTSKHQVTDLALYQKSYITAFQQTYGPVTDYVVLALLPSYLERDGSSLVYMVNDLIQQSAHAESGFYLNNINALCKTLKELDAQGKKVLLIGVSFALLDLVEQHQFALKHTIVMETGGMKGRRKELIRPELHARLKKGFGVSEIHSEYGMTELLSQAYSTGSGVFKTPKWMKVLARDTEDPLTILNKSTTGGLNIIDLANINSCAFIATQDLAKVFDDGSFEVLGRFDNSDIRGCNLMVL